MGENSTLVFAIRGAKSLSESKGQRPFPKKGRHFGEERLQRGRVLSLS